ncbi:MAG: alpha-amylase, partial [Paludibacteraceae bacterium]|nr:alpha-amylase [Paludibacteraceae bacterium]
WYETVKLNYGIDYRNGHSRDFVPRPNTWTKMCDILLYWCGMGADGFRCDMAEMVPVEFWNWVIPTVKEKYPDVIFIAETYDPSQYRSFIYDGKFDYLYDKVGLYDTLRGIMRNENSCHSITGCWQKLSGIEPHMLNFLENHDEQRIASDFFASDAEKGRPAMVVSACINKGPVMLYFGQELGEKAMDKAGFSGVDGRTTIFDYWAVPTIQRWLYGKLTKEERNLRAYYASLLNICRNEKAISEGSFFDLTYANFNNPDYNTNKQYAFFRKYENECLLIVVNFENNPVKLKINIPQHAFDVLQLPDDGKEILFTDLLSRKRFKQKMSYNSPFSVDVEQNDSVVLKFDF